MNSNIPYRLILWLVICIIFFIFLIKRCNTKTNQIDLININSDSLIKDYNLKLNKIDLLKSKTKIILKRNDSLIKLKSKALINYNSIKSKIKDTIHDTIVKLVIISCDSLNSINDSIINCKDSLIDNLKNTINYKDSLIMNLQIQNSVCSINLNTANKTILEQKKSIRNEKIKLWLTAIVGGSLIILK